MTDKNTPAAKKETTTQQPAAEGAPMRLRIADKQVAPSYTNAFRSNASAEEVILDFGMDVVTRAPRADGDEAQRAGEIVFEVSNRLVMNYYTAKRLAIVLGQLLNNHEAQFGEIKLNVNDRLRNAAA